MKTGRNDPCHCGSGLKYKKCCLKKEGRIKKIMEEKKEELTNRFREEQEKKAKTDLEHAISVYGEIEMLERCKPAMVIELNTLKACLALEVETIIKQGEITDAAIEELKALPISQSREATLKIFSKQRESLLQRAAQSQFGGINKIYLDLLENDAAADAPADELAPEDTTAPAEVEAIAEEEMDPALTDDTAEKPSPEQIEEKAAAVNDEQQAAAKVEEYERL